MTGTPSVVSEELPSEPRAVGTARRLAVRAGDGLLSAEKREELKLVVSEVVSNAVRYGSGRSSIRLVLTPKGDYICGQVTDSGPGLVPRPGAIQTESDGGFGLFIVEHLARRWGVTREAGRTRVWFELAAD